MAEGAKCVVHRIAAVKPETRGFRKISYSFTIISVKRKSQQLNQLACFLQLGTLEKCKPTFLLFSCWIDVLFLSLKDEKSSL